MQGAVESCGEIVRLYIIVKGHNLADLEEKVEEQAVEGYEPTGSVSLLAMNFCQPMFHFAAARAANASVFGTSKS